MPKNAKKTDLENLSLCHKCDDCCRYVAVEIDKPTTKAEKENIKWLLLHENISVYFDHDHCWYVEFKTPCKGLSKGLCSIYEKRPATCREYHQDDCTKYNSEPAEKRLFTSIKQFENYLKK